MKPGLTVFFLLLVGSSVLMVDCSGKKSPAAPAPGITETFTPTATGATPAATASDTATPSFTPTPTLCVNAQDTPCTLSPTSTWTGTDTATSTTTDSPTPTGTWDTPTPTPSPFNTWVPCFTPSPTFTGTACPWPPSSTNWITGTVDYNGTGMVDGSHFLVVNCQYTNNGTPYDLDAYSTSNSGTYAFGVPGPGTYLLSAYYDFNGISFNIPVYTCPSGSIRFVAGERYTHAGACASPAAVTYDAVTVTGSSGTTVAGPGIVLDDNCSFEGVYGIVTYTGTRGIVQYCRKIYLRAYSDAGYSNPLPYGAESENNPFFYDFVTNLGSGSTGLAPIYLRVWFSEGPVGISSGDPYLDLGPVAPTADGLRLDINFDDTYIK